MSVSWEQMNEIGRKIRSRCSDKVFLSDTVVAFTKRYGKIAEGTKAIVSERQGDYYAVTVNGSYIEGIHKNYLTYDNVEEGGN